jgi:hypothetical protein
MGLITSLEKAYGRLFGPEWTDSFLSKRILDSRRDLEDHATAVETTACIATFAGGAIKITG